MEGISSQFVCVFVCKHIISAIHDHDSLFTLALKRLVSIFWHLSEL